MLRNWERAARSAYRSKRAGNKSRGDLPLFRAAAAGRAGVFAVAHGKIIPGNHVFKRHSSEADAFLSVGAPPAGTIDETGRIRWEAPPQAAGEPWRCGTPAARRRRSGNGSTAAEMAKHEQQ